MLTRSPQDKEPRTVHETSFVALRQIREKLACYTPSKLAGSEDLSHAAVALILRDDGASGEPEILIIRRAEHPHDPWSGHLGFPGGRVEPEDTSHERTAVRETQEELGVWLDASAKVLGRLSEVRACSLSRKLPLSIFPFVYELVEPVVVKLNGEVVETRWIPLRFFTNLSNRSTMPHPREPERMMPCYRLGDRAIWGLSLSMLDELLLEVLQRGATP